MMVPMVWCGDVNSNSVQWWRRIVCSGYDGTNGVVVVISIVTACSGGDSIVCNGGDINSCNAQGLAGLGRRPRVHAISKTPEEPH
jgi:hypothetical protein